MSRVATLDNRICAPAWQAHAQDRPPHAATMRRAGFRADCPARRME